MRQLLVLSMFVALFAVGCSASNAEKTDTPTASSATPSEPVKLPTESQPQPTPDNIAEFVIPQEWTEYQVDPEPDRDAYDKAFTLAKKNK